MTKCKDCIFFVTDRLLECEGSGDEGTCRYNPPSYRSTRGLTAFPSVQGEDWCGKSISINEEAHRKHVKALINTMKGF